MTPVKKTSNNDTFSKWALGLCTTALMGAVAFLWSVNAQLAQIQSDNRARDEKVTDIRNSQSHMQEDITTIKEKDLQDIKDRLKTIEIKNENRK